MNNILENNEDLHEEFKTLLIKIEPHFVALKSNLGIYEVLFNFLINEYNYLYCRSIIIILINGNKKFVLEN